MLYLVLVCLLFGTGNSRPNILTIIADDMGWNDVGFHGQTQIPTPNIDALAYSGVTFSRHYTLPVCTPSRAAYLTGYHPLRTGLQGYPLKAGEKTALPLNFTILPEYLKNLGYRTHLIGKWHLGYYQSRFMPTERGFDDFLGYLNGNIGYFSHELTERNITGLDFRKNLKVAREYSGQYATRLFTNETINIINEHDSKEPFYIQMSHLAPHYPLEVISEEENDKMFGYIEDPNRRLYAGLVAELDKSVGEVIDALKKKEILNNTIIVFFSDNGGSISSQILDNYGSNWPLRAQKFTLFEGGIRGNAVLWTSNLINPGRIYDSLFHLVDWLPTLYSAAGGDIGQLGEIDGINQWEFLLNDKKGPRTETLLNIDQQSQTAAYWKDGWKLIVGNRGVGLDGYYGPVGRSQARNATAVVTSLVAQSLVSVGVKPLVEDEIDFLANRLNIQCQQNVPDRNARLFLFNLIEDPCESENLATSLSSQVKGLITDIIQHLFLFSYLQNVPHVKETLLLLLNSFENQNISTSHSAKVKELLAKLIHWNSLAVPVASKEPDPLAMPSLHGGAWGPWLN